MFFNHEWGRDERQVANIKLMHYITFFRYEVSLYLRIFSHSVTQSVSQSLSDALEIGVLALRR